MEVFKETFSKKNSSKSENEKHSVAAAHQTLISSLKSPYATKTKLIDDESVTFHISGAELNHFPRQKEKKTFAKSLK